jgi:hypothetical protein
MWEFRVLRRLTVTELGLATTLLPLGMACLTPRSMVLGQTASAIGSGNAELGFSGGVMYQLMNQASNAGGYTSTTASSGFTIPALEANAQYGLNDMLTVNLHGSAAGVEPGLKITLASTPIALALLPEVALGYIVATSTTTITSGGNSTTTPGQPSSEFVFLAGARVLVTAPLGFYGAVGYHFESVTSTNLAGGGNSAQANGLTNHAVDLEVGYEFRVASFRVRPEVALVLAPAGSSFSSSGNTTVTQGGVFAFAILPSVTLATSGKLTR